MIGLTVVVGLALLPGQTEAVPSNTTSAQALPEPEMATTSTSLAPASQAVMSDATFSLIPAAGLDGFVQFAGPVEFDGRFWIAGNRSFPSSEVTVLSSVDGSRWVVESSVSAGDGNWLIIDDLDIFGGVLMAVGSTGQDRGAGLCAGRIRGPVSLEIDRWSAVVVDSDRRSGRGPVFRTEADN